MQPQAPVQIYTPFVSGKYDVSPGLNHVHIHAKSPHERLLQIDCQWPQYQQNKQACRKENIHKYYLEQALSPDTRQAVQHTLIRHLCQHYPPYFQIHEQHLHCQLTGDVLPLSAPAAEFEHPKYLSLFDALAAQIQEDLAVWQLNGEQDWLAALHVCAPNHWAPAQKIGLNFDRIHASVPGMESQRKNYLPHAPRANT